MGGTQTFVICNGYTMTHWEYSQIWSGMTRGKVASIVGEGYSGEVTDEWSVGRNDYEVHQFDRAHEVYFTNGKVYAKFW